VNVRIFIVGFAVCAAVASAAVFEQFLSPDDPADRAIQAYLKIDAGGKATSDDLAELGVLLMTKGFPKDAERYLERAVKLDKTNTAACYRLGLVLQREGKLHAAMRQYRKVLKVHPGHGYARFMLALAEERKGNLDRAAYDFARAYEHAPELANPSTNPLVLDSHVQVQAQILRYRRATDTATPPIRPIDPVAVQRMMAAAGETPAATPAAQVSPTPSPAGKERPVEHEPAIRPPRGPSPLIPRRTSPSPPTPAPAAMPTPVS
jgi:tetratricopeptide (TPR) repeat protein